MNVILLSGGSGTRLWPLSNEVRSKQFLKIFRTEDGRHESMVQRMYRMIKAVDSDTNITIATSQNQFASIKNQLGDGVGISIEPCRRDTFPAIALAAAYLHDVVGVKEDESVLVCPVDPLVDFDYFKTLKYMSDHVEENGLTLMGIKPTYPSEKYGYIIPCGGKVAFKEKPNAVDAERYISEGALWNGGVFAFKLKYVLDKAARICGTDSYKELYERYEDFDRISFDYAVAEKEDNIQVVRYDGDWKDLGTWNTLTEAMQESVGGVAVLGENCENVHVINELSLPLVVLGIKNAVVVASPDGILVSDKGASSYLKKYVPESRPMFEKKLWGEYKVLDFGIREGGQKYLTKELCVLSGRFIGYHKHFHKTEVWTCVQGEGKIILDGVESKIKRGDVFKIEPNVLHSVYAKTQLSIIEVQFGDELSQDDIERSEFDWNANALTGDK